MKPSRTMTPNHGEPKLVPVPDHAQRALRELDVGSDFHAALAEWVSREAGKRVSADDVAALELSDYLRMNLRVTDLNGRVLGEGRELRAVRRTTRNVVTAVESATSPVIYRAWDFGDLPVETTVERAGLKYTTHPALEDRGTGVVLRDAKTLPEAETLTRAGVLRLLMLALPEQYKFGRKRFTDHRELVLLGQLLPTAQPLADALALRVFEEVFLPPGKPLPRTAAQFEVLVQRGRADLGEAIDRLTAHTLAVTSELRAIRQTLSSSNAVPAATRADVEVQLKALLPEGYPQSVPAMVWTHLAGDTVQRVKILKRLQGAKAPSAGAH